MLFDRLAAAVGNLMSDVLRTAAGKVAPGAMIASLAEGVAVLIGARDELLAAEPRARSTELRHSFVAAGAPEALAAKVKQAAGADCADCHSYHAPIRPTRKEPAGPPKAIAAKGRAISWGAGQ